MTLRVNIGAIAAAILAIGLSAAPSSATTIFNLAWSGARFGNSAQATGQITIDETQIPNPGSNGGPMPSWVTALTFTVTGASTGNGTFTLADFDGLAWDTNGATLDLGTQLIGQPTMGAPWGTAPLDAAGDFNLFASLVGAADNAPNGTWWFTLTTALGSGDQMYLTYFGVPGSPDPQIPEPATIALLLAGLAGAGAMGRRRKS